MTGMSIGQLARRAGVNVETVRYYERRGLMPEPAREPSGYRRYDSASLNRLLFIRRAKELGFTLKEIAELLALRTSPETTCEDVRKRVEIKIHDIEEKIHDLKRFHKALKILADACGRSGPSSECPILDALESGETTRNS